MENAPDIKSKSLKTMGWITLERWNPGNSKEVMPYFLIVFKKLPDIDLDKDIRMAFNGKLFYIIYQQTGQKQCAEGVKQHLMEIRSWRLKNMRITRKIMFLQTKKIPGRSRVEV